MPGRTHPSAHAAHAAALLQLAKSVGSGEERLETTLARISEAATAALGLERCGVWLYDGSGRTIRCVELHEASLRRHTAGLQLAEADHPVYFAALAKERVIAAHDAVRDPRTAEFAEGYLKPLGIGSLLDAPVWLGGRVVGIVCQEHVGPPRRFTDADESFAGAIADLVSLALQTDRRLQAEDELRRREAHLRTLSEVAHDLVIELDPEGRVLYLSANAPRVLGPAAGRLLGLPLADAIHAEDRAAFERRFGEALAGGAPVTALARHQREDGEWRTCECALTRYVDDQQDPRVVIVSRDVTERLAAERATAGLAARLSRIQRLESVGRLAGGIAHDFNNMLTVITSAAEELLASLPADSPLRAEAQHIADAATRSAALTRQLLAFGSREMFQPRVLDATALVRDLERMLARVIGEDIRLRLALEPGPVPVLAEPAQLEQALVNLAVNARDAMPQGGELVLAVTRRQVQRSPDELLDPIPPGEWVVISVSDTGVGIDDSLRERIFEPFFTTKDEGRGTGLGLATVYGLLRQLGGSVGLRSRVGAGSEFALWLPARPVKDLGAEPATTRSGRPPSSAARILLVEDERLVRELVSDCLQRAGHQVLVAAGPEEALALAAREPRADLLISDVVMPELSGVELWHRLSRRWPGLPAVFMSGYPDRAGRSEARVPDGASFLPKPFRLAQLLASVEEALAAGARHQPVKS